MNQTPKVNNSVTHAAAGNLAFLLSVIRCGETLSPEEEAHIRDTIARLSVASDPAGEQGRIALENAKASIHESAELIANCYCSEDDDFNAEVARLVIEISNAVSAAVPVPAQEQEIDSGGLLPCPFCGLPAKVYKERISRWWYPTCTSEVIDCPGVVVEQDEQGGASCSYSSEQEAVKAWNTRARTSGVAESGDKEK